MSFDYIKNNFAIAVNGVGFHHPGHSDLGLSQIVGEPMTYNCNSGVVSFIDENGIPYIAPYYEMVESLEKMGYVKDNLFVPYSTSLPPAFQQKWNLLYTVDISSYLNELEETRVK